MPDFAVYTKMLVKDDVTKAFSRMGKGADKFGGKADKAFRKASKGAGLFKSIVGGILTAKAIQYGMRGAAMAVRSLTDEILEFDQASSVAGAKFGLKRGTKNFDLMQSKIREVGAATEYTAGQAGRGMQALAQQGFKLGQAMGALKTMTDLATNAEIGLAEATTMSLDTLGAFGLRVEDPIQNMKNLVRVNDVLVHTINSSSTNLDQLYETMRYGATTMKSMSGDIETFSALLHTMAEAGIKGSQAGTALKQMFLKVTSKKARKELDRFGIKVADNNGNLRDMFSIVKDMASAYKGMGNVARASSLKIIFGERAIVGFNKVLDMGADKLEGFRKAAYRAGGESVNTAEQIRRSLSNRVAKLKSAAVEVGLKFWDAFGDKIPGAITEANKWISTLNVKAIIRDISGVVDKVKILVKQLDKVKDVLQVIVSVWAGMRISALITSIGSLTVGLAGLAKVAAVLKFAIAGLGGPWGLLIAAFVWVGIEIFKHLEEWKQFFRWLVDDIKEALKSIEFGLTTFKSFFVGVWEAIANAAIFWWDKIKGIFSILKDFIGGGALRSLMSLFKDSGVKLSTESKTITENRSIATDKRQAPNAMQTKQTVDFRGNLTIAGAPKGSVFEGEIRGASPMRVDMLGVNP